MDRMAARCCCRLSVFDYRIREKLSMSLRTEGDSLSLLTKRDGWLLGEAYTVCYVMLCYRSMRRPIGRCYFSCFNSIPLVFPTKARESWTAHADTQPLNLQVVQRQWPSIQGSVDPSDITYITRCITARTPNMWQSILRTSLPSCKRSTNKNRPKCQDAVSVEVM
jgi:hypothetical protein